MKSNIAELEVELESVNANLEHAVLAYAEARKLNAELLEALEELYQNCHATNKAGYAAESKARAAIAKARGQ